jgi:hypothetical protein
MPGSRDTRCAYRRPRGRRPEYIPPAVQRAPVLKRDEMPSRAIAVAALRNTKAAPVRLSKRRPRRKIGPSTSPTLPMLTSPRAHASWTDAPVTWRARTAGGEAGTERHHVAGRGRGRRLAHLAAGLFQIKWCHRARRVLTRFWRAAAPPPPACLARSSRATSAPPRPGRRAALDTVGTPVRANIEPGCHIAPVGPPLSARGRSLGASRT